MIDNEKDSGFFHTFQCSKGVAYRLKMFQFVTGGNDDEIAAVRRKRTGRSLRLGSPPRVDSSNRNCNSREAGGSCSHPGLPLGGLGVGKQSVH